MQNTLTQKSSARRVSPAFNGDASLPRLADWPKLSSRLAREPLSAPADPALLETGPGRRYAANLSSLGLKAEAASVRAEASEAGMAVQVELRCGERSLEDRWEIEVDANGVMTGIESENCAGHWIYRAGDFSRFFDALLREL